MKENVSLILPKGSELAPLQIADQTATAASEHQKAPTNDEMGHLSNPVSLGILGLCGALGVVMAYKNHHPRR